MYISPANSKKKGLSYWEYWNPVDTIIFLMLEQDHSQGKILAVLYCSQASVIVISKNVLI